MKKSKLIKELEAMNEKYRGEGLNDRFLSKIKEATAMPDGPKQTEYAKIRDDFYIHLLAEWAKGNIEGPRTTEWYDKKISQTKGLIKLLKLKEQDKSVAKQEEKLLQLEKELAEMQDKK